MREVCIVPIAFVSDHVETLGEIDHEARHLAGQLGFTHLSIATSRSGKADSKGDSAK